MTRHFLAGKSHGAERRFEGWMSVEVPIRGDVVMRFQASNVGESSKLHVTLRGD